MKHILRKCNLYWLSVVFWACSFLVTRGKDGNLSLFILSFSTLAIAYCIFMPVQFKAKLTWHTIGHLIVFTIACIIGFYKSSLDGMAGSLYLYIPVATIIIVMLGRRKFILF